MLFRSCLAVWTPLSTDATINRRRGCVKAACKYSPPPPASPGTPPTSRADPLRGSAADLGHALGRSDEAVLVDQVALFLQPDGALDHPRQVVVGGTPAHQVAQRRLMQREQTCAQPALRGQPDAVAGRAEGL